MTQSNHTPTPQEYQGFKIGDRVVNRHPLPMRGSTAQPFSGEIIRFDEMGTDFFGDKFFVAIVKTGCGREFAAHADYALAKAKVTA